MGFRQSVGRVALTASLIASGGSTFAIDMPTPTPQVEPFQEEGEICVIDHWDTLNDLSLCNAKVLFGGENEFNKVIQDYVKYVNEGGLADPNKDFTLLPDGDEWHVPTFDSSRGSTAIYINVPLNNDVGKMTKKHDWPDLYIGLQVILHVSNYYVSKDTVKPADISVQVYATIYRNKDGEDFSHKEYRRAFKLEIVDEVDPSDRNYIDCVFMHRGVSYALIPVDLPGDYVPRVNEA